MERQDLFTQDNVKTRVPNWYNAPINSQFTDADEDITVTQAMKDAGLMVGLTKFPQVVDMGDGTSMDTRGGGLLQKATRNTIPTNSYAVMREPTGDDPQHRFISTVGKDYQNIQPTTLARLLDPMTEQFKVDTVGATADYKKLFVVLDAGVQEIATEECHLYYLIVDSRDGNSKLQINFTPIRVWCTNMLTTAVRDSNVSISLSHNQNIEHDTAFYMGIFAQMGKARDHIITAMDSMAHNKLTEKQVEKVLADAYPNPSEPPRLKMTKNLKLVDFGKELTATILNERTHHEKKYKVVMDANQRLKDNALNKYFTFNEQFPKLAKSSWAIYNAIVETEDFRDIRGTKQADGNVVVDKTSTFLGSRAGAKARAFDSALALVR